MKIKNVELSILLHRAGARSPPGRVAHFGLVSKMADAAGLVCAPPVPAGDHPARGGSIFGLPSHRDVEYLFARH